MRDFHKQDRNAYFKNKEFQEKAQRARITSTSGGYATVEEASVFFGVSGGPNKQLPSEAL